MMPEADAALTARAIFGTAPSPRDEGTPAEAYAAGMQARRDTSQRVAPAYRSFELQRAFISGWKEVDRGRQTMATNPYREALLSVDERVGRLGGFQHTPRGEFFISLADVKRMIAEELQRAEAEGEGSSS